MTKIRDFWIFWWAPRGILSPWRRDMTKPQRGWFCWKHRLAKIIFIPMSSLLLSWLCWLLFNQLFKTHLWDFPSISKSLRLCEKIQYTRKRSTGEATDWNGPDWRGGMGCSWHGEKREVWGTGNKLVFMDSGAMLPFPVWLRWASQADLEAGLWGD